MRYISIRRLAFSLVIACSAQAAAQTITFTRIADTNTPLPGGTGNFTSFGSYVSLDGSEVVLFGGFTNGIYRSSGGSLLIVANTSTSIPGGSGTFTNFQDRPSIEGGKVAFSAFGTFFGVYTSAGGTLSLVADSTTTIPGGSGPFGSLGAASQGGNSVVFRGNPAGPFPQPQGIYTNAGGPLRVVADQSTAIPGGSGAFTSFENPFMQGSTIGFAATGTGGQSGIYLDNGGSLAVRYNTSTPIPGGSGNFTQLSSPSLDDDRIAFRASGSLGQIGLYTDLGGSLAAVADKTTPIPGGIGNFAGFFNYPSLSGNRIAFEGHGSAGQEGIYIDVGGTLSKVIDLTDSLDGKPLFALNLYNESLSGDRLAFNAFFTDGSRGVFVATITMPVQIPALPLWAAGTVLLALACTAMRHLR